MRWFAFLLPVLFLSCDGTGHPAQAAIATTQLSASVVVVDPSSPHSGTAYPSGSAGSNEPGWRNANASKSDDPRDADSRQPFGYSWFSDPPAK